MAGLPVKDDHGDRVRADEGEVIVEEEAQRITRDFKHYAGVPREVMDVVEVQHGLRRGRVWLASGMLNEMDVYGSP